MTDRANGMLEASIWRGRAAGAYVAYRVLRRADQTVLDAVTYVQRYLKPGLGYRFACRVGMCGSCAMTVNGRPRWTCRTRRDPIAWRDGLPCPGPKCRSAQ